MKKQKYLRVITISFIEHNRQTENKTIDIEMASCEQNNLLGDIKLLCRIKSN